MRKNTEHLVFKDEAFRCKHCGTSEPVVLPIDIPGFSTRVKAFSKRHVDCKPDNVISRPFTKAFLRGSIDRVSDTLNALVCARDVVDESATRLELDLGEGTNWVACFKGGLIIVTCGDMQCVLAFDDPEKWKPIAIQLVRGLYWANQAGVRHCQGGAA